MKTYQRAILALFLAFIMVGAFMFYFTSTASAVQRAVSVQSLTDAYHDQIASIDMQIASSTNALAGTKVGLHSSFSRLDEQSNINKLKDDKHQLELTYRLLLDALK